MRATFVIVAAQLLSACGGADVAGVAYSPSRGAHDEDILQYRRNLDVLALVGDLGNLQKKSDDRLTTVPVQLVR